MEIQPYITEKTMQLVSTANQYTFIVPKDAEKIEIARMVEERYRVPVEKVRTQIRPGKVRRNPFTYRKVKRPAYKIAYVTLPKGKKIAEFEEKLEE